LTLDEIAALEQEWIGKVQVSQSETYFDWQPSPVGLFTQLLEECLPYVQAGNQTFLDVGCGIGTKCLIAASYGLSVSGIDRVSDYIDESARLGIVTQQMLIEDFADYADYGLVYVNHPRKDQEGEADLERQIQDHMSMGSVLLAINYGVSPNGWTEVARQGDWNAAWVKSLWSILLFMRIRYSTAVRRLQVDRLPSIVLVLGQAIFWY
jgi:SAM-dependent methyltransferase